MECNTIKYRIWLRTTANPKTENWTMPITEPKQCNSEVLFENLGVLVEVLLSKMNFVYHVDFGPGGSIIPEHMVLDCYA